MLYKFCINNYLPGNSFSLSFVCASQRTQFTSERTRQMTQEIICKFWACNSMVEISPDFCMELRVTARF